MTNDHTNSKPDKHPARSARILTTGISLASVLGLTSAYSFAAQTDPLISGNELIPPALSVAPSVTPLASDAAVAPTQPAPATPATVITLAQSVSATQAAPVVAAQTQVAPAMQAAAAAAAAPITIMILPPTAPATRSSGSK